MVETSHLIQQAREALDAGDKQKARQLLQQSVRQHPDDFASWLWLARVAASPSASLAYVERAEQLQPNHPTVQKARAWAEKRLNAQTAVSSPPKRPFCPLPLGHAGQHHLPAAHHRRRVKSVFLGLGKHRSSRTSKRRGCHRQQRAWERNGRSSCRCQ